MLVAGEITAQYSWPQQPVQPHTCTLSHAFNLQRLSKKIYIRGPKTNCYYRHSLSRTSFPLTDVITDN